MHSTRGTYNKDDCILTGLFAKPLEITRTQKSDDSRLLRHQVLYIVPGKYGCNFPSRQKNDLRRALVRHFFPGNHSVLWCSALKHSDPCADANLVRQDPKIENKSRKNLYKHHLPGNARKTAL